MSLISSIETSQINFILSLQHSNGAIMESATESLVYTRDLALAAIALTLSGHMYQAQKAIQFLVSLPQQSSNFTGPSNTSYSSPPAWCQIYTPNGQVLDPSLRGEDQGMALFAISTFVEESGNTSIVRESWQKIENSANFILYLQHAPEPNIPFNGLYRHGNNWHDERPENMQGKTPIYWPFWPEYYQWEEENMRMIKGLEGAIFLAQSLGYPFGSWNQSVKLALVGLKDNESMYDKYETYDYFGSVLWNIQTNLSSAKALLARMPSSLFTSYGVKDLSWEDYAAVSDTIDYMTCLVRVGNITGASELLRIVATDYVNPRGGFYDGLYSNGIPLDDQPTVYSSARFAYFAYVAFNS